MRRVLCAGCFAVVLVVGGQARADWTTRCGRGRVATVGDLSWEVLTVCGDPDHQDRRVVQRAIAQRWPGRAAEVALVSVTVERWIYDDGPDRLVRVLTFEDGRLVRIETRGFGRR